MQNKTDTSPKVSIIVPVYNVERYLTRCLGSLVSQTLEDIEIIVVNDGSPDNSQAIIDAFAEKCPEKVVPLRQENKGLGPARNFGAAHARGEYVGFVDSDDWVAHDMFKLMYEAAKSKDADVVICDYYEVDGTADSGAEPVVRSVGFDSAGVVPGFVRNSSRNPSAWNKLYRRNLAQSFPYPKIWYEDLATTPVILTHCKEVAHLPQPLYYYLFKRPDSIMSQPKTDKDLDMLTAYERCITECNSKYLKEMAYALYRHICSFLKTHTEHFDEIFLFLWKHEDFFANNQYVSEGISEGTLLDLSVFMNQANKGAPPSPYVQNLVDFLDDTTPLCLQLDSLSQDTLAELCQLYGMAVQSATDNAAEAGPRLLMRLSSRYERILKLLQAP